MTDPYFDQDGMVIYHGDVRDVLPTLANFAEPVYKLEDFLRRGFVRRLFDRLRP